MSDKAKWFSAERELSVILLAAVIQGWTLYWLHTSVVDSSWPASDLPLLLGFYVTAGLVPLTLQFFAPYVRQRATWIILASFGCMLFFFGWHVGFVFEQPAKRFLTSAHFIPFAFALLVLWLMAMPFAQARLAEGRWRPRYQFLFSTAWTNKQTLSEAFLFTVLFWCLLFLWQQLFNLLQIPIFEELFEEPIFAYPVTAIVFGIALHLIGSIQRVTAVVLEQLLSVLKWLALIAALILALFTVTLVVKLPGMLESGDRIISAAWLLWLVAIMVLLVNAAYRDGSVERPYPPAIAFGLRSVIPLMVIIAATAAYALYVRIARYGFTVERVWASIVAAAAVLYSVGYALASRRKAPWMGGIARVNVAVGLFLIGVIALALTPILSPYRIAANSQYRLALAPPASDQFRYDSPIQYLRFDAGEYGRRKLEQLAKIEDHPRAAELSRAAAAALQRQHRHEPELPALEPRLEEMIVHPVGRDIESPLLARIKADMSDQSVAWVYRQSGALIGAFLDLNSDGTDEFVVISGYNAIAYTNTDGTWKRAGRFVSPVPKEDLLIALREEGLSAEAPALQNFRIGSHLFHFSREH